MLHILYTQEEGGDFSVIAKHTDKETRQWFEEIITSKTLLYQVGDRIIKIKPAYVSLVETLDDYDFVLQSRRDAPHKEALE